MSFFFHALTLTCKRLTRRAGMIAFTLMLPLLCGIISIFLARGEETLAIRVGIASDPRDSFADAICESLSRFESPIVFERYPLEEQAFLEEQVMTGEMECAYLIAPDLSSRLENGRTTGGITLLKSPGTVLHSLAGEMLFASILWQNAPELGTELLIEVLGLGEEQARLIVNESFSFYQERGDIFLTPVYLYRDGGTQTEAPPAPEGARLLHGLIALFLLTGTIWSLPAFIDENSRILSRIPRSGARRYMLGVAGALFLAGMVQGALALAAIRALHPVALKSLAAELGWLAVYQLAVSMAGVAVLPALRRSGLVYGGGIFLLLLTAALGGVALDLGEISARLAGISRIFLSSSYIGGALEGGTQNLILLVATSAAGLAAVLLFAGFTRRNE